MGWIVAVVLYLLGAISMAVFASDDDYTWWRPRPLAACAIWPIVIVSALVIAALGKIPD